MKQNIKNWLSAAAEALLILLILYVVCFPAKVDGSSMEPGIFDGDTLCISRLAAWMGWYDTGDIITFTKEVDGESIDMVKRVIALEGDTVGIENGVVTVNGKELEEPYAAGETEGIVWMTVPVGEVFVMGDNRSCSTDSRFFGTIRADDVQGKVIFRLLPLSRWGLLEEKAALD